MQLYASEKGIMAKEGLTTNFSLKNLNDFKK